jgi:hypothetical protein
MKSKSIQYAMVILSLSLSACGPSKEVMCEKINENRSIPNDTKADKEYRYVQCLNASDDYVKKLYKEIMTREKNK